MSETENLHTKMLFNKLFSGIAMGYWLDDRRVRVPAGTGNFSLHHRVQTGFVAHPAF
jgi:hypothetical protein